MLRGIIQTGQAAHSIPAKFQRVFADGAVELQIAFVAEKAKRIEANAAFIADHARAA